MGSAASSSSGAKRRYEEEDDESDPEWVCDCSKDCDCHVAKRRRT